MAEQWTRRARRWASKAAMPAAILALAVLLVRGALAQLGGGLSSPLYPLVYLLGAGYALALPLRFALPALGWLLGLDAGLFLAQGALPVRWPLFAAHAAFTGVFAALYHGVLAARLRAARIAEEEAVRRRLADAERSAREFRLVATAPLDPDRQMLAAVSEIEESVRGALSVAAAALQPHTVAVFLLSPDGATVRLRDSISRSDHLFRGPLPTREGARELAEDQWISGGGAHDRVVALTILRELRDQCRRVLVGQRADLELAEVAAPAAARRL